MLAVVARFAISLWSIGTLRVAARVLIRMLAIALTIAPVAIAASAVTLTITMLAVAVLTVRSAVIAMTFAAMSPTIAMLFAGWFFNYDFFFVTCSAKEEPP